jgi:VanZ family protein
VKTTLPALLWTLVVLAASSDLFSGAHTGSLIATLFAHRLSPATIELLNFLARKSAHVIEYAILGALWFRAVRGQRSGWTLRWAVTAIAIAASVALVDEWHQSFIPSRTASPFDALLDTAGATLAQLALRLSPRAES